MRGDHRGKGAHGGRGGKGMHGGRGGKEMPGGSALDGRLGLVAPRRRA